MNRRIRSLVCGALFLSVLINSYMWSENKNIQGKGENLKREQLRKKIEHNEEFLRRIQGEVRKTLKKETSCYLINPELHALILILPTELQKTKKLYSLKTFT
jgi:hypothetical protein